MPFYNTHYGRVLNQALQFTVVDPTRKSKPLPIHRIPSHLGQRGASLGIPTHQNSVISRRGTVTVQTSASLGTAAKLPVIASRGKRVGQWVRGGAACTGVSTLLTITHRVRSKQRVRQKQQSSSGNDLFWGKGLMPTRTPLLNSLRLWHLALGLPYSSVGNVITGSSVFLLSCCDTAR